MFLSPSEYVTSGNDTINRACVNDQPPIFERQRKTGTSDSDYRSLITSLKLSRNRARAKEQPYDACGSFQVIKEEKEHCITFFFA